MAREIGTEKAAASADTPGNGAPQVTQLLAEWKAIAHTQSMERQPLWIGIVAVIALTAIAILPKAWAPIFVITVIALLLDRGAVYLKERRPSRLSPRQLQILDILSILEETSAAEPLLVALPAIDPIEPIYGPAARTLARLLSRLKPDEARALFHAHRDIFYSLISLQSNIDLQLAALNALRHANDSRALVLLARLIVYDAPTQDQQRARRAARLCLDEVLPRVDFGGPASLADWIRELSEVGTTPMSWDQWIQSHLALQQILPGTTTHQLMALGLQDRLRLYNSVITRTRFHDGVGVISGHDHSFMSVDRLGSGYEIAVLDAAMRAQDLEALPMVRTLASTESSKPLRAAAQECLPTFEALARQGQIGRTLLRASMAPSAAAGSLLRPVNTAGETDPHQLLRANVQGSEKARE